MQRRHFLKSVSSAILLMQGGSLWALTQPETNELLKKKPVLRFAVVSDGHYGQPDTDYRTYFQAFLDNIRRQHATRPFACCIFNGDIIHDDPKWFPEAKAMLDQLPMPYYVSQGNHDHASPEQWLNTWNMPVNHEVRIGRHSFLIATTSNEKGEYLCPDLDWLANKLEEHRLQENIFIILHITPQKWTANGVDCPGLMPLLNRYKNVQAVFNGHDHDQDSIRWLDNIPFLFDSHIGGSWGTSYRAFRVVEMMADRSMLTYLSDAAITRNKEILTLG